MSLLFICFASCLLGSSESFVLQGQKEIQKRINPLEAQGAAYIKGIEGRGRPTVQLSTVSKVQEASWKKIWDRSHGWTLVPESLVV